MLDEPTAGIDVEGRHEFWQAMRAVAGQGKTVLFATHYLEEADAYADRIVLIARGQVIADGPATEIKARAGLAHDQGNAAGCDTGRAAARCPGVVSAERHGDAVLLSCSDADTALRALLASFPAARDIEVRGGSLEEAFLELTADEETTRRHADATASAEESTMSSATHFSYEIVRACPQPHLLRRDPGAAAGPVLRGRVRASAARPRTATASRCTS